MFNSKVLKVIYKKYCFFIICVSLFLMISCGGGSSGNSKSDQTKDFEKTKSLEALRGSILTIPENIQLVGEASSGKKLKKQNLNKSLAYEGLWANNYEAITETINYSDLVKKNVISFLDYIFETKDLSNAELNTFIETGEGEIWAYLLEDISKIEGEKFKWKLSIFFRFSHTADVICRFSFVNGKMKGQILENGYVTLDVTRDDETITLTTYLTYDIRFDGTSFPQTLDIDYVKDLSEIFHFVELYWDELTEEQYDAIKLSQIGKSSVKIVFDGLEYGITGTSYSPYANFEANINLELPLYGENRSTYSFRAKSITGEVDGAKMEVALPEDTLEDVSNIWEENSVSNLFQKNILDFMNSYLNQLIDEVDDSDISNSTYLGSVLLESADFTGSTLSEKQQGIKSLYSFLGNKIDIPTLSDHGLTISTLEFDNAVTFWGTSSFTDFNINSVDDLNDFLASNDTSITNENKEEVYYFVMAPLIITTYQATPVNISMDDIESFLESKNDYFSNGFLILIESKKHIYNPAFFEKENGFLGTYDGTNFYQYELLTDTLNINSIPANFETLNGLDLSTLSAIPPQNVFDLSIKVK